MWRSPGRATFGAPFVLYVDAATFFVSFVLLALFVPGRPPVQATEESGGVLAGIAFLFRDRLLRVLGATALITNGLGQMIGASLTVLAYEEYSSSRVAGSPPSGSAAAGRAGGRS